MIKRGGPEPREESNEFEQTNRLLDLILRMTVHNARGDKSQTEMILALVQLGFRTNEIMSTLGAPMSPVAPIVSRARKQEKGRKGHARR